MTRKILIGLLVAIIAGLLVWIFLFSSISDVFNWLPLVIVSAALVDSVNPCAFSVLFLTIAFLFSLGKSRSNVLSIGLLYIAGIFFTYTLIGVGIMQVLTVFSIPHFMARVGGVILAIFGFVSLINDLYPKFPIKLKIPSSAHPRIALLIEKASLPTAFFMGILVGVFEFPCTGGPYLMVLGLLHDYTTRYVGFLYLVLYNFIFISPLLLILLLSSNKYVAQRIDKFRRAETHKARIWLSVLMIALGVIILLVS